ncbi:MAG: efflux RND transporter periplasmic adaptor subunit [Chloroflexota bacterium]|nr:efflux RND transporter periplasmic adaptor subunit [Chloroflexota bacterium]
MTYWEKVVTIFVFVAIIGSSFTIYGCGNGSDESSEPKENVIVEVERGTLLTTVSAFGSISMPHQSTLTFGSGGAVSEVGVEFGDSVKEGQILVKLDTLTLQRSVKQAESSLRTAQINLEKTLEPSSAAEIAQAEATVESAEASLAVAEDALNSEIENIDSTVRDARVAFENAQRSLDTAQKNSDISIKDAQDQVDAAYKSWYDFVWANSEHLAGLDSDALPENAQVFIDAAEQESTLYWAYQKTLENLDIAVLQSESSIATAQNNVTKTKETLMSAEENLTNAQVNSVVIQQKESAVATAKAALAKAKENLAEMKAGADPLDIELKQIQVDNAQRALDEALETLEESTIEAPFDGVVASIGVSVGDSVSANTVIVHLVDIGAVEIDATVDEIDVAMVEAGQMASITIDAIPDAMLLGKVMAVSPLAVVQSGIVTYEIDVEVRNPQNVAVRAGMTASIEIVILKEENVLLVPSQAIKRSGQNRVVEVVIGEGETEERIVETGSSDAMRTEILSGLEEGEKILVQASGDFSELMQKFQGGGMRMPGMGGGRPLK